LTATSQPALTDLATAAVKILMAVTAKVPTDLLDQ
jgi:hypothetical protein